MSKGMVAALTVSLVLLSTFAWFMTTDSVQNNFKSGNPLFNVGLEDDFDPRDEVELDEEVDKVVAAKNTEDIDAFVRIMVFPTAQKDGEIFEVNLGDQVTLIGIDDTQWKDGKDGYYYYLGKLAPGQTTPNLFEKVKISIPDEQKEEYKDVKFDIVAKTEAIHTKSNDYRISWWGSANAQTTDPLKTIDEKLQEILAG
ncbi:hypothetical protein NRIC_17630 [Enterococcus florum]|uniref:Uncharacterized protein n=1 Tax=Enterococcus florum TaxID=2480627 RepID=A0A4P5PE41_9ENTE|nr:hypothetical protein [Enterococcus florum]GCF93872.1 hypothetical protein NRIC_17630 [Enterococcus florum]